MPWRQLVSDEAYFADAGASLFGSTGVGPDVVAEFNAIVAPLEVMQGRRLDGYGRRVCMRAFMENPDGFRRLVAILGKREGVRRPLGVLIHAVDAGDHNIAPLEKAS
jgi:hypothetical protein